jgi:hypothetical protein
MYACILVTPICGGDAGRESWAGAMEQVHTEKKKAYVSIYIYVCYI